MTILDSCVFLIISANNLCSNLGKKPGFFMKNLKADKYFSILYCIFYWRLFETGVKTKLSNVDFQGGWESFQTWNNGQTPTTVISDK